MKKDWFDRDLWGNMGIWTDGWRGASIEVSIRQNLGPFLEVLCM